MKDDHEELKGQVMPSPKPREPFDFYTVLLIIGVVVWLLASILIRERIG